MPRPSFSVFSARAHKPLISFVGKRTVPFSLTPAHPHPAAPPEYRKVLQHTPEPTSFSEFWDAPVRFWRPKNHELQESEIELIQSGGASLL